MSQSTGVDLFMKQFKYFKSNKPQPSLNSVISVDITTSEVKLLECNTNYKCEDNLTQCLGLINKNKWKTYSFVQHPGLMLIRNPFTGSGQRYWIKRCLERYPKKPNKINIDIEIDNLDDWWRECHKRMECDKKLLKKLRWTTLGYHHNWNTKAYSEENKTPFPEDLSELSSVVAQYLGFAKFRAEAAIVNYYHKNSTLSAHTDHSEVNLDAPLFSFSFGQSAIFLIGGREKSIEPSAILLKSGDIVVMSKEARLCYHAVPKILPEYHQPWNSDLSELDFNKMPSFMYISNPKETIEAMNEIIENDKWSKFENYIKESRININVRQVLNEKQISLADENFS